MVQIVLGLLILCAGFCAGVIAAVFLIAGAKDKSEPPDWDETHHQRQQATVGRHQTNIRINKDDITWEI